MSPKYVCMTDEFYSAEDYEAMNHLNTYPDHEVVAVDRNDAGEIETRLIRVGSEKNLET